jgi:hypothetical protein
LKDEDEVFAKSSNRKCETERDKPGSELGGKPEITCTKGRGKISPKEL